MLVLHRGAALAIVGADDAVAHHRRRLVHDRRVDVLRRSVTADGLVADGDFSELEEIVRHDDVHHIDIDDVAALLTPVARDVDPGRAVRVVERDVLLGARVDDRSHDRRLRDGRLADDDARGRRLVEGPEAAEVIGREREQDEEAGERGDEGVTFREDEVGLRHGHLRSSGLRYSRWPIS